MSSGLLHVTGTGTSVFGAIAMHFAIPKSSILSLLYAWLFLLLSMSESISGTGSGSDGDVYSGIITSEPDQRGTIKCCIGNTPSTNISINYVPTSGSTKLLSTMPRRTRTCRSLS